VEKRCYAIVPDENLAQSPVGFAVLELLGVGQLERGSEHVEKKGSEGSDLKVHVAIRADEEPLVFEPPLETNKHRLPGQLLQERLWVDRGDLQ